MYLNRAMSGHGFLVLATWLAGGEANADAHCVSSELYCNQWIASSAPSHSVCCDNGYDFVCGSYDIPAGTLSSNGVSVIMSDSFQVVGPAEGTPLEFTAQLILTGYVDRRACGFPCSKPPRSRSRPAPGAC